MLARKVLEDVEETSLEKVEPKKQSDWQCKMWSKEYQLSTRLPLEHAGNLSSINLKEF